MQNWIICILIFLCLVLNGTSTSSIIIFLFLVYLFIKNISNLNNYRDLKILLFVSFFISFLFGLSKGIELTQLIRFFSVLILFWTYPLKFELKRIHLILLLIVGVYLIIMQLGRAIGISVIDDFITTNYPNEKKIFIETVYDNIDKLVNEFDTRLAGIASEANTMAHTMLILFATIIIGLRKNFSSRIVLVAFICAFISILVTGGRTGLVTFIIMNIFIFKDYLKQNKKILLLFISGFIILYFNYLVNFRAFDLLSLFDQKESSGSIKMQILLDYFMEISSGSIEDFIIFIFGYMNWDRHFDAELGNVISFYGVMGLLLIVLFFIQIYKATYKNYRWIFFIFLISIGGTILLNYRFGILTFLALSSVNQKNILTFNKKHKQVLIQNKAIVKTYEIIN